MVKLRDSEVEAEEYETEGDQSEGLGIIPIVYNFNRNGTCLAR